MNQWPLIISCFKQLYNEQHSEQYSKLGNSRQALLHISKTLVTKQHFKKSDIW